MSQESTTTDSSAEAQSSTNGQPNPNPPAPFTEESAKAMFDSFRTEVVAPLQESNRRLSQQNAELQQRLAAINATPEPEPGHDVPDEPSEFHKNPKQNTQKLIRDELRAVAGPLIDEIRQGNQKNALDTVIDKYSKHPKMGEFVKAHADDLRTVMQNVPADEGNFLAALSQVKGSVEFGLIPSKVPSKVTQPTSAAPATIPAKELPTSLAPSAPPVPKAPTTDGPRQLNETDFVAMKIGGWDRNNPEHVKEYLAFNDSTNPNVSSWNFTQTPPKK